jgi:Ni,Fe-hydrogenase I cytochrome b subunit
MTGYALVTDLLININFYATFGVITPYLQGLFIIIGFIMFLMLLFKLERFKNSFTYFKLRKYDEPLVYTTCWLKQKKEPK